MESDRTINIQKIFLTITLGALVLLVYISFSQIQFKNNPLSSDIQNKLLYKEKQIQHLIYKYYGIKVDIPIKISSKIDDNLFGLASYDGGDIKIILNKNRFQESSSYMIDSVLPHEYAHAMMFVFGNFTNKNGGHSLKWQEICLNLGGDKCDRFVKHNDIVLNKIGLSK